MSKISLLLVVHNEEQRLPGFFDHIRPHVDEIVAVVQASTDRTLELCQEFAHVVVKHPHYGYAEASRLHGYRCCSGDWVLVLSPDENLTPYGLHNLRAWCEHPVIDAYALREVTAVAGQVIEDVPHPRLFRNGTVAMTDQIHTEMLCATGRIVNIVEQVVIEHYKTQEEQDLDNVRYAKVNSPSIPMPSNYRW